MRLPPHTPQHLREGLAAQPSLRRRIALGWITVGGSGVVFVSAMAVAHYVYGVPVHDRNTGELSTAANTLMMLLLLGGGGLLFFVMGILLLRWKPA